jgi:hypothetical protein
VGQQSDRYQRIKFGQVIRALRMKPEAAGGEVGDALGFSNWQYMKTTFISVPTEIEAEQFNGKTIDGVCWPPCKTSRTHPHVHTAHDNQPVDIEIGDWIVPEPNGAGFYPIKDEIFQRKYRPVGLVEKTLHNSDISGAKQNVPDIKLIGDGDTFLLLCKASSDNEGWMKSTKAMAIKGVGCLVQVTTQQKNPDGSYAVAEALSFIPKVQIVRDLNGGRKLESWYSGNI